jgi:hypothetical protein
MGLNRIVLVALGMHTICFYVSGFQAPLAAVCPPALTVVQRAGPKYVPTTGAELRAAFDAAIQYAEGLAGPAADDAER